MRQISSCGINCFTGMNIAIAICCIVALSTTYWLIELSGNCVGVTYSLYLRQVCVESSGTSDDCVDWEEYDTPTMTTMDQASGKSNFLDAYALTVTSAVLSVICAASVMGSTTLTDIQWVKTFVRIGVICVLLFISIVLIISIAITSDNYYTDPENYNNPTGCDSTMSYSDVGFYFLTIAVILSISACMGMIYPCYQCMKPDEDEAQDTTKLVTASAPSADNVA